MLNENSQKWANVVRIRKKGMQYQSYINRKDALPKAEVVAMVIMFAFLAGT